MPHPADKIFDDLEAMLKHLEQTGLHHDPFVYYDFDSMLSALRKLRFDFDRMVDIVVEEGQESDEDELSEMTIKAFNDLVESEVAKRMAQAQPPTE